MDQPLSDILVTGGSGYIGRPLVERLREQGLAVTNLDLRAGGPGTIIGDVRRPPAGIAGPSVVIHCAGLAGGGAPSAVDLQDTNVEGTRAVVRQALDDGAGRVILVSTIAVLGPSELPLDESAPVRPTAVYGRTKAESEVVARELLTGTGVELVIVRPGYVFGPDHPSNFGRMVDAIRRGRLVLPGREDTIKAGIYRPDLVTLLADLAVMADPPPLLHAVHPDTPTVLAWARQLQSLIAPDRRVRVVPDLVASAGLSVLGRLASAADSEPLGAVVDTVAKLRESSNVVSRIVGGRDWPFAHTFYSAARDLFG